MSKIIFKEVKKDTPVLPDAYAFKYEEFEKLVKSIGNKMTDLEKNKVLSMESLHKDKKLKEEDVDKAIKYLSATYPEKEKKEEVKKESPIISSEKPKDEKPKDEEKKKDEKKEVAVQNPMLDISMNDRGMLTGKNMDQLWILAQTHAKSGLLPKHFDTPQKVMTAMQYCAELGLPPITGMRQIYIVNGSPAIWGDLPLAICNNSGELEDIDEFLYDFDYNRVCFENKNLNLDISKIMGAICKVRRKGRSVVEKNFTVQDAINAFLLTKDFKGGAGKDTWGKYPKKMLIYRARAAALKFAFPDKLNGVNISEYDNDYTGESVSEPRDITPEKENLIAELNDVIRLCREENPEFNKARELDIMSKHISNQDIRNAEYNDIVALIADLKKTYLGEV